LLLFMWHADGWHRYSPLREMMDGILVKKS